MNDFCGIVFGVGLIILGIHAILDFLDREIKKLEIEG